LKQLYTQEPSTRSIEYGGFEDLKKIISTVVSVILLCALCGSLVSAFASGYAFESGADTLKEFGGATSYDEPVTPDPMSENYRRNKDAAYLPPPYFYGSGDIPTSPSSLYHDNYADSAFAPTGQDLPPTDGEDYTQGMNEVYIGWQPSAPQSIALDTAPSYYANGSVGTLYIHATGKTVTVYEGENLDNLKKGAGHFTSTSSWDGNVALCGHNRGNSAYFRFVKDMQMGDRVTYNTKYGARVYEVIMKEQIGEYDNSKLAWSGENLLTLITCVENVPELRWAATLREVV
jgi:sortase A